MHPIILKANTCCRLTHEYSNDVAIALLKGRDTNRCISNLGLFRVDKAKLIECLGSTEMDNIFTIGACWTDEHAIFPVLHSYLNRGGSFPLNGEEKFPTFHWSVIMNVLSLPS